MKPDPLRHFEEQFESYELLNRHREWLIAEARKSLRDRPGTRFAGMICTPDSPDLPELRRLGHADGGRTAAGQPLVRIVPLASVQPIVDRLSPHVPPLPDDGQLRLPVVVSTRQGHRLGVYVFAPESGD